MSQITTLWMPLENHIMWTKDRQSESIIEWKNEWNWYVLINKPLEADVNEYILSMTETGKK